MSNEEIISEEITLPAPEPTVEMEPEYIEEKVEVVAVVKVDAPEVKKPTQNVVQDFQIFSATTWNDREETIDLPSSSVKDSLAALESTPNISLTDSKDSRKWGNVVSEGLQASSFDDAFVSTLEEEGTEFRQAIVCNGASLAGAQPRHPAAEDENLKGERGILRFMTYLGVGSLFQAPLWHSGFWITFKAPSEGELLELQRQITSNKINLGRQTYGMVFSNTSAYITDRLVSFALDHVYSTTLKDEDPNAKIDLKTVISSQDIPALIWGLLCSIYPRGFQYRRGCTTDPEKCNHVLEERLNLSKIQWPNIRAFTPWQVTHMSSRRANSRDLSSIKRYKDELLKCQNRVIELNKESGKVTKITLKIPTVANYIDSGNRWISEITSMVNSALGMEANDKDRNEYILRQGQATAMRQYMHWVEAVEFSTNRVDDVNTLEGIFDFLSSDDIIRNEFMEAVSKYINETSISVIGIPTYNCPKCGSLQEHNRPLPAHTNIIPIDVYQIFFGLLAQKLERVSRR